MIDRYCVVNWMKNICTVSCCHGRLYTLPYLKNIMWCLSCILKQYFCYLIHFVFRHYSLGDEQDHNKEREIE